YYRSQGIGALHELQAGVYASTWWTTDGRWTPRGNYAGADFSVVLPGYEQLGIGVNLEGPRYDVPEGKDYGVPQERVGGVAASIFGSTDRNRPGVLSASVYAARHFRQGPGGPQTAWGTEFTLVIRPFSWWETQLIGKYDDNPQGTRYVDCLA